MVFPMFEYSGMNIITLEEAAKRKGVSTAAIYKAIHEGRLVKVKIVGVTEESLNAYEPDTEMIKTGKRRKPRKKEE